MNKRHESAAKPFEQKTQQKHRCGNEDRFFDGFPQQMPAPKTGHADGRYAANEKKDLREYRIITKDNKVVDLVDAYDSEHDADYQKLVDFLKDYR